MSNSPPEPSIWSIKLHDTLSFDTPQGVVDVLRVAPGWIYAWRGTNIAVLVPYCLFLARVRSGSSGECVAS
jgi:hypothetical protein